MSRHLLIALLLLSAAVFKAQQSADSMAYQPEFEHRVKYVVETIIGTRHTGYIVRETRDSIVIQNSGQGLKMGLRRDEIVRVKAYPEKRKYTEDEILGENTHAGNYLFSSSAFEFDESAFTTNNHWILLQEIDYAVSENWAITSRAFAFYPFSVGVRCAYRVGDRSYIGTGVFGAGDPFSVSSNGPSFWGYGLVGKFTHGSTNRNFTVSGGLLGINSQLLGLAPSPAFINLAFANVGYCNRFSPNLAFAAEGWYFPDAQIVIGGLGLKLVRDENYCWSFGCYSFLDTYNSTLKIDIKSFPIPYIGISRKFN